MLKIQVKLFKFQGIKTYVDWGNVKGLFGDLNISTSFLTSEDGLLTNFWGRKVNQPLSLSPRLRCIYLFCSCYTTLQIHMYFACIVC